MAFELTIPVAAKGGGNWHHINDGNFTKIKNEVNNINAQLGNIGNGTSVVGCAATAGDLGNLSDGVTKANIFANPPLDKMSRISRHNVAIESNETNSYKSPLKSSKPEWWEVITLNGETNRAVQIAIQCHVDPQENNAAMFIRTRHIDSNDYSVWQDWKRIAFAEQPAKANLPLSPEFSSGSEGIYYSKGQFGRVLIEGHLWKSSSHIVHGEAVATLPTGYRPPANMQLPATVFSSEGGFHSGVITINTDGKITIATSMTTANFIYLNLLFSI